MRRRTYLAAATSTSLWLAGCTDATVPGADTDSGDDGSSTTDDASGDLPGAAGTDDDFEDLEAWDVSGGRLKADTDRAVVGTQSGRLEITESDQTATLAKTFAEPRDLADVAPGVATASDDLVVPWLRLVDEDRDSIVYRRGIKADVPLMRYNFGVESVDDGFDETRVVEVQLQVRAGDKEAGTVWFDDFHFTPRPETGKVMIQFDDNHVTDYTKALPILEEYGYSAVSFVNPGRIEAQTRGADEPGGFPRVNIDQLHELRDAGWTIANHCYNHPALGEEDPETQEKQIARGKEWLESEGFDGARYFAYPHGSYDETTLDIVNNHHEIGFAGGLSTQGYTTNANVASRIGEPDAERVRKELERTVEMRGITSVLYHRLEDEHLEAFETMIETIHEYESNGDLEVILPRDLEDRFLF